MVVVVVVRPYLHTQEGMTKAEYTTTISTTSTNTTGTATTTTYCVLRVLLCLGTTDEVDGIVLGLHPSGNVITIPHPF